MSFENAVQQPCASHAFKCNPSLKAPCVLDNLPSPSSHTLSWKQPREALARLDYNNPCSKAAASSSFCISSLLLQSPQHGQRRRIQRGSPPVAVSHPINPLHHRYRRKEITWMFSPLSSPCVQLSSPAAHLDPLPCYTYTRTHVHPQRPTRSPFTAPPSPKPLEQRYHLHQEAEKHPLLFPFLAASPPPQSHSLSVFPHPSAPTLRKHSKPGGEVEDSYLRSPPEGSHAGLSVSSAAPGEQRGEGGLAGPS